MADNCPEFAGAVSPPVEANRRILLADQDAATRNYVARVLSPRHRIDAVADGEAVLSEARKSPPGLMLIDATMAKAGGSNLLRELRGDPVTRCIPILMLSAGADQETQAGSEGEADDYLTKPFGPRELLARVRTLLELGSLRLTAAMQSERLRAAAAEAEAAGRAKDEFLAALGHELRNPLAPIISAVQLMKLRGGRMFLRERAAIERQAGHLVRLVDDLLDAARLAQARMTLRKQVVEMKEVVTRALEMARSMIEHRRHHLNLAVPADGLCVDGDMARLAQALGNLLTNAASYTRRGGTIAVTGARDGDQVVVRISDNGAGIAPELLPRVFELFTQGPRGPERSAGGIGIGLAIARGIVALHGGTMQAYSQGSGKGAEFTVRLPAAANSRPAQADRVHRRPRALPAAKRLLVVDDNRDSAEMLRELLQMYGYVTRVAYDGPSALHVALAFRPDVALVDIGLPLMDGYEVARRIRQLPQLRTIRLIAVTGYSQASDRRRSEQAGFDLHLVKPVDPEELKRAINYAS
jgi:signal transduction histidine kinase